MTESVPRSALRTISGTFFRIVPADCVDEVLAPHRPDSAGRYHRPGQPALYMSPRRDWAMDALSGHIRRDGRARVIVPLALGKALVLDQRDEEACRMLGIDRDRSNAPWRPALATGREPPSWHSADLARAMDAAGLIDRSRVIPGGWDLCLFRWNGLRGPSVSVAGAPVPVDLDGGRVTADR